MQSGREQGRGEASGHAGVLGGASECPNVTNALELSERPSGQTTVGPVGCLVPAQSVAATSSGQSMWLRSV